MLGELDQIIIAPKRGQSLRSVRRMAADNPADHHLWDPWGAATRTQPTTPLVVSPTQRNLARRRNKAGAQNPTEAQPEGRAVQSNTKAALAKQGRSVTKLVAAAVRTPPTTLGDVCKVPRATPYGHCSQGCRWLPPSILEVIRSPLKEPLDHILAQTWTSKVHEVRTFIPKYGPTGHYFGHFSQGGPLKCEP